MQKDLNAWKSHLHMFFTQFICTLCDGVYAKCIRFKTQQNGYYIENAIHAVSQFELRKEQNRQREWCMMHEKKFQMKLIKWNIV